MTIRENDTLLNFGEMMRMAKVAVVVSSSVSGYRRNLEKKRERDKERVLSVVQDCNSAGRQDDKQTHGLHEEAQTATAAGMPLQGLFQAVTVIQSRCRAVCHHEGANERTAKERYTFGQPSMSSHHLAREHIDSSPERMSPL